MALSYSHPDSIFSFGIQVTTTSDGHRCRGKGASGTGIKGPEISRFELAKNQLQWVVHWVSVSGS